jgi:hypothetical protein
LHLQVKEADSAEWVVEARDGEPRSEDDDRHPDPPVRRRIVVRRKPPSRVIRARIPRCDDPPIHVQRLFPV